MHAAAKEEDNMAVIRESFCTLGSEKPICASEARYFKDLPENKDGSLASQKRLALIQSIHSSFQNINIHIASEMNGIFYEYFCAVAIIAFLSI